MRRGLLFVLVVALLAACTRDSLNGKEPGNGANTINAKIDDYEVDVDTRAELKDNKHNVWTENDEITVYYDETSKVYRFNGKTGDRSGSFTLINSEPLDKKVEFDQYYALYATSKSVRTSNAASPAICSELQSVQQYKEDSYDPNAAIMLGSSRNGKDFEFANVLGYLRLAITGDKVVKSIQIEGNNNEVIAGGIVVNTNYDISRASKDKKVITLDCGEGVQLTDQPTNFYFSMIPMTFENGVSFTITFDDDTLFPKATTQSITITRNTVLSFGQFNAGDDIEWQTINISHKGQRVSAPLFNGGIDLAGIVYWGDGFMTNINKETSYVYTDGQDAHTITTKTYDATAVGFEDCTGIIELDLTGF